jgi:hypothetical protein
MTFEEGRMNVARFSLAVGIRSSIMDQAMWLQVPGVFVVVLELIVGEGMTAFRVVG